jgi:uncharacterized protein (DUF3820 family)
MKLTFGRYKGCDLRNVPQDYLRWMLTLNDLWPPLRAETESLLARYAAMRNSGSDGKSKGRSNRRR